MSSPEQFRSSSIQSTTVKTPKAKASAVHRETSRAAFLQSNNKHKHEPSSVAQRAPTSTEQFKGVHKPSVSTSTSHSQTISGSANVAGGAHESTRIILEDLGVAKADVEFRKDLVTSAESLKKDCSTDLSVKNFKHFRKVRNSSEPLDFSITN